MKPSSELHAAAMRERNSLDGQLSRLLSGTMVTFSKNCVSGFEGVEHCQCWRCKGSRGEEVTRASEKLAEITADRLRFGGTREERTWKYISRNLDAWNLAHGRGRQ